MPQLFHFRWPRSVRRRMTGVSLRELKVVDPPTDMVVHELEHAGYMVFVDVRDVDEVECQLLLGQLAESGRDELRIGVSHAAVDENPPLVPLARQKQAIPFARL